MVRDQNPSDKAVRATSGAAVSAAPVAEGVVAGKGGGVIGPFATLKHMAGQAGRRLRRGGGGEGGRGQYGRTFEEEHSCKQPLLVKVRDCFVGVRSSKRWVCVRERERICRQGAVFPGIGLCVRRA